MVVMVVLWWCCGSCGSVVGVLWWLWWCCGSYGCIVVVL